MRFIHLWKLLKVSSLITYFCVILSSCSSRSLDNSWRKLWWCIEVGGEDVAAKQTKYFKKTLNIIRKWKYGHLWQPIFSIFGMGGHINGIWELLTSPTKAGKLNKDLHWLYQIEFCKNKFLKKCKFMGFLKNVPAQNKGLVTCTGYIKSYELLKNKFLKKYRFVGFL